MEKEEVGDEMLGEWVYCMAHLAPHRTGWCTVDLADKVGLEAKTRDEAYAEVRANGWTIYGES